MALTLNGSNNTIAGVAVGGLPDGIVDTDMIAATAVTAPKKGSGSIVQIVSTTKTARAQSSADSGGESGTLFEASITPTSSSNKILLFGSMTIGCAAAVSVAIRLKIDGALTEGRGVGIAVGNRRYVTSRSSEQSSGNDDMDSIPFNYLDSPNTTSQVTYSFVGMHSSAQTRIVTINRSENDANQTYNHTPISTMTLMEVVP